MDRDILPVKTSDLGLDKNSLKYLSSRRNLLALPYYINAVVYLQCLCKHKYCVDRPNTTLFSLR